MRIITNIPALYAYRELLYTNENLQRNMERLASGYRINRAADDVAGLAITEQMTVQIQGMRQAERNAQDAISFLHVMEGGMEVIDEKLQRLRQLAVQCSTETYTSADRAKVQLEVDQLIAEIDRIASAVAFNNIHALKGGEYDIHIGHGEDETIRITVTSVDVTALGIRNLAVTGVTNTNAEDAVTSLDAALSIKMRERTELGAYESRLINIVNLLRFEIEGIEAARSRIRDVDYAKEAADFVKNQVLSQAGTAMLAQANMMPQTVLQLLG
jgi:flagellin